MSFRFLASLPLLSFLAKSVLCALLFLEQGQTQSVDLRLRALFDLLTHALDIFLVSFLTQFSLLLCPLKCTLELSQLLTVTHLLLGV